MGREEWRGIGRGVIWSPGCGRALGVPWERKALQGQACRRLQTPRRRTEAAQVWSERRGLRRPGAGPGGQRGAPHHRSVCPPQVTLIPTFDSAAMHEWYEETHPRHQALGITVLGSNSTVSMQDEAFPACKVEF